MQKIEIQYIGSKGGYGWYEMTWLVNKEVLITIDTWYLTADVVFAEFIADSPFYPTSSVEVKAICDKVISSLSYSLREKCIVESYIDQINRQGEDFYRIILNKLKYKPKTT